MGEMAGSHCRRRLPAVMPVKAPKVFQLDDLGMAVVEADVNARFIRKDIQGRKQGSADRCA